MQNRPRDKGFTLIEVMVTTALLGVMMAIAVSGWMSWAKASAHSGTARELQSLMRQTQQRAVTEGNAMCLLFDVAANNYTMYRGGCDNTAKIEILGPFATDNPDVHISTPVFTSTGTSSGATFYARGTASPGTVKVTRTGSSKQYVVTVEGLTGRVALS